MENAKPSSSAPPYPGGAGAGGKFRKPPVSRKRPSTPYDRPPVTTANNKSDESQDAGGGWLSKLVVNPARRLIVGGATRILPSFFSKSDSSSADEYEDDPPDDRDDEDIEETGNTYTDAKDTLELGVSRSSGDAGPSNTMDKLKGILDHNIVPQNEPMNSPGGLATIENMLKGKQFSRDERNRLMEILNSRLVDVSSTEKTPKENVVAHQNPSRLTMGKQYDVERAVLETPMPRSQPNIQEEVTASPIDIARAYMGNRTSEKFSYSIKSKDEIINQNNELISSKPHFLTPSSKPSTCWPGAMVQEPRGYLTPQIQRTRYGLHDFPKTPYSRTIYSTTKSKMSQLQSDSKPSNVPLNTFQQSRTPIYSTMKSSGDDGGYGSVGPIRRVRNKFSEPQSIGRTPSRSFVPVFQKNPEASGTLDTHEQTFKHGVSGTSSETVRKIMEQLDRHKPTPKEKQEELKLATEWKKLPSQDDNNNPLPKSDNTFKRSEGGVSFKETEPIKSVHVANNASAGPSFNFANTIVTNEKSKSQPWSTNGQDVTKKRQSQPILKPITFTRPDPQQVSGFTFPFSATASSASEPPTPSIMPTFPATGVPPPAYTFGMKKSERLVFSFPSTSSGSHVNDSESDLKFDFGSDKKRVSFASIGKDAIAIN